MVHLPTLEAMEGYYEEHLHDFVREHPGEYVLIGCNLTHTFYNSEDVALRDYPELRGHMVFGTNPLLIQIPKRYVKPWSQMDADDRAKIVHRETERFLARLDEFEERSKKFEGKVTYG